MSDQGSDVIRTLFRGVLLGLGIAAFFELRDIAESLHAIMQLLKPGVLP